MFVLHDEDEEEEDGVTDREDESEHVVNDTRERLQPLHTLAVRQCDDNVGAQPLAADRQGGTNTTQSMS